MEPYSREERRKIFRQDLYTLREEGYLSEGIVETVVKAHHKYNLDSLEAEAKKDSLQTGKNVGVQKPVTPRPQKVKKVLTPEEVRERNITWSLNIGVIFLLIGGLFVATSNWESMTSLMKSGSIAIVACVFFGLSLLSKKVLHIDKTAFAFIVLGCLFLPIFILSLGWYGLLGRYLSISGEGRYLLGMLGSLIPIIIYIHFAKTLKSRLFVWFTFVSLTSGIAFLLASLHLKIDLFYLGLIVFNAILIYLYRQLKGRESLKLFMQEFVPYVQANLIICTLFMLFLFENEVLYSFNLLITAIMYLSMIYVSGRKEYHFVFSAMLAYGAYELIEHSILESLGAIFYALIGFGFVFLPKVIDEKFSLDKVFQLTSAVISGLAFIYISLEGILLRAGNPSIVLMMAYLIMTVNFAYLSRNHSMRLFPYLSSAFLASSIYEALSLIAKLINGNNFSLILFLSGFILVILVGIVQLTKNLKIIQMSSRDVGTTIMAVAILAAICFLNWWELGVMLLLLVLIAYLLLRSENRLIYKEAALWILPSSLGLAVVAFGTEVSFQHVSYQYQYGNSAHFAIGAFIVLLSSFGWKKIKEHNLEISSLYISEILYTVSMANSLMSPLKLIWVQPLVLTLGIGMYYLLYKKIGAKWVSFFVSFATLLAYFSIVYVLSLKVDFNQTIKSIVPSMGAVILLWMAYLWRKKDKILSDAYAWLGHCIYPFALVLTWFMFNREAWISFCIAVFVYSISTRLAAIEWKIKIFLYGNFTSIFFVVTTGLDDFSVKYLEYWEFPITSGILVLFWIFATKDFKKRTIYFVVPFTIIGLFSTLGTYPFNWIPYLVTCLYAAGSLLYLHKIKWDLLSIIPLLVAFLATIEFSYLGNINEFEKMLLSAGLGILMVVIGQMVYKCLFARGSKLQEIKIDGYTVVSFLFFSFMYYFENQHIWTRALPGFLIAATIWLQGRRVPNNYSVSISILGGSFLLQPYYSIIRVLNVPVVWWMELDVLPWIVLIIFIRIKLKGRYSLFTKWIEWGVLIAVSLLLIQDGLATSTIKDAIILGTLSLMSMLAGMFLHIKSYFFVGSGVLLLNAFLQTRPYWGNMPWWGYLLISGLILISVASSNEWQKQKIQKGESTFITVFREKIINKIKKWD